MQLSILIPMYNAGKFIGQCLDSLLAQNIQSSDYEIIILDDGSTDNGPDIVEEYMKKHSNIVLHRQTNVGTCETRNRLFKLAKGKYIYGIDNDDYIAHNALGTLLNYALEYDLDILGFETCVTTKRDLLEIRSEKKFTDIEVTTGIECWSKLEDHHMAMWWYLVKNDLLKDNGIDYGDDRNPLNDTIFTFELFIVAKRAVYLPMDVYRYVQEPSSIMHVTNTTHLNKMIEYQKTLVPKLYDIYGDLIHNKDPKALLMSDNVKYTIDLNVYFVLKKLLKVQASNTRFNKVMKEFKTFNAYPMTAFENDNYFSNAHKFHVYLFNHKYLLFLLNYPIQLLTKLKLINIPV